MSRIRSKDTKPELIVRSVLHKLGYRFRLHRKDLPGCPDIVLPKFKTVIFVHGCFWHMHENCRDGTLPKTNQKTWKVKLQRNIERDILNIRLLENNGWSVIVIWECEANKINLLMSKIDCIVEVGLRDRLPG
jgi:DNA mismatch endonuclease, patch repair protein